MTRIQTDDFDISQENKHLQEGDHIGAIVTFTGIVREFLAGNKIDSTSEIFHLEHYPGMTERVLDDIESQAKERFEITTSSIIHRVGTLKVQDNIVFVGAGSKHRTEAFQACQFMIDILKTQAPFWKKEGSHWVEAKDNDIKQTNTWLK